MCARPASLALQRSPCTVLTAGALNSAKHRDAPCHRRSRHDREDVRREVQILHHLGGHPHITQLKGAFEGPQSVHLVRLPPAQGRSPEAGWRLPALAACQSHTGSCICRPCLICLLVWWDRCVPPPRCSTQGRLGLQVMELCSGGELFDRIVSRRRYRCPPAMRERGMQACQCLLHPCAELPCGQAHNEADAVSVARPL